MDILTNGFISVKKIRGICAAYGHSIIIGHGTIGRLMVVTFIETVCLRFGQKDWKPGLLN